MFAVDVAMSSSTCEMLVNVLSVALNSIRILFSIRILSCWIARREAAARSALDPAASSSDVIVRMPFSAYLCADIQADLRNYLFKIIVYKFKE